MYSSSSTRVGAGILCAFWLMCCSGCELAIAEAWQVGVFDFISGSITDSLAALLPIADTVGG